MASVRRATMTDVDAITEMVAAAFAHDAGWSFMLGEGHVDDMRAFAHALLVPRVRRLTVWVTDDCLAVAMWDRVTIDHEPDADHIARWAAFRKEVGEDAWQRVAAYDLAVGAEKPARPYWYLGVLATHPAAQGRGLASVVLQPALAAAAADGWDCWLETSSPANKAFYAGRGFTESRPVDIAGGPDTWWLGRPHPEA